MTVRMHLLTRTGGARDPGASNPGNSTSYFRSQNLKYFRVTLTTAACTRPEMIINGPVFALRPTALALCRTVAAARAAR